MVVEVRKIPDKDVWTGTATSAITRQAKSYQDLQRTERHNNQQEQGSDVFSVKDMDKISLCL